MISSPVLLAPARPEILSDDECGVLLSRHAEDLVALDRDPAPLMAWLEARLSSPLLGRYFEALVGFWIQHLLRARRFESSIVVSRDRRTIGELDFVFEDSQGIPWHWEVAVKFYLCKAVTPGEQLRTDAFWGAMTQDRLDKKLAVIFDRQLGMPYLPEGRLALAAAGFEVGSGGESGGESGLRGRQARRGFLQSRLLMKGMLFYPVSSRAADSSPAADWTGALHPPEVSAHHWRGWWATALPAGAAWTVLKRKQWLSPFWAPGDFIPLGREEALAYVTQHFLGEASPLMLASLERAPDGSWREADRGLVMRPGWPGSA